MHRGRYYPLSPLRAINANQPYPRWLAAAYQLDFPPATGLYSGDWPRSYVVVGFQPGTPPWQVTHFSTWNDPPHLSYDIYLQAKYDNALEQVLLELKLVKTSNQHLLATWTGVSTPPTWLASPVTQSPPAIFEPLNYNTANAVFVNAVLW